MSVASVCWSVYVSGVCVCVCVCVCVGCECSLGGCVYGACGCVSVHV